MFVCLQGARMEEVVKVLLGLVVVWVAVGGQWVVDGQVHHVVGDDRGWDLSSDVTSWLSGRKFSVGDIIWFAYSAAQENLVELGTKEEYDACNVSNPVRTYTNGLDRVPLDREEIRYFASGTPESCKKGLKMHVEVKPWPMLDSRNASNVVAVAATDGPVSPSASTRLSGLSYVLLLGFYFTIWACWIKCF
ncbi:hypothetical protein NMG60_11009924 [Bertholletia excelsa]